MSTKEKLFETALCLFSEKGFNATTIRDITGRTGLTPGTFYNHFAGKDELLQAVYDYYSRLYIQPREPAAVAQDYERLLARYGPAGLFEFITKSYIDAMRNEKLVRLTKIILMEQYTNPIAGEIARRDRQRLLSSMEELFVLMDRLGHIRVRDPRLSGRLLGYVYLGFAADNIYCILSKKENPDEIAARQTAIILQYLREILIAG
jgi:AcrR family transcriptional regulator